MAIEELLQLVPPPRRVNENTERMPWHEIELAIGTLLPSDYRDFGRHYGSGQFEDGTYDFWVINPLSPKYVDSLTQELDIWRSRREAFPDEFPDNVFPELPGVLPWGHDVDGGMMGWCISDPDPNLWPVITKASEDSSPQRFEMSFTTFLAKALQHQIRPRIWRADYPEDLQQVVFRPDS